MFSSRPFLYLLMAAVLCLPAAAEQPSVILITLDTTRADRMGFLGSKRGLTPNLDALAKQSAIFTRAYSQVPLTTPSHATILTGTYPQFSQVVDLGSPLGKDLPYLPDILRKHGYHTAAFVGSQVLDPRSAAAPGFDRGFDTYDAAYHSRSPGEDRYHSVERRATVVVQHAVAWLQKQRGNQIFLWVHLYDPHDPYDPPPPFKAKYASAPYDGEIAYSDFAVGKLIAVLRADGIYDKAVIAVAADHGEALGEHGEQSHGLFLYDDTIHVPLLIKLPAGHSVGRRVTSRVSLVDLAPTLLRELGIEVPTAMQGTSLAGPMKADGATDHPAYAETDYPYRAFGWSSLRSWRAGKYLYIDAPEPELYDQSSDPEAVRNLASDSAAVSDTMQSQLDQFRKKTSSAAPSAAVLSPDQAEQLQALGYISSNSGKSEAEAKQRGTDPKDKVAISNLLHQALLNMDEEHYKEAIPQLQQLLNRDPNIALANLELGRAFNNVQDYTKALPFLQKAVELSPDSGRAHYELGVALGETGDWAAAATQLEAAVPHAPDSEDMRFYLGMAYDELGRTSDAAKNFEAALKINPDHYRANLLLGRILGMQNEPAAALPYLQRAVKLEPDSPDAHKFLANVYTELGQEQNARREQAEADRLKAVARP